MVEMKVREGKVTIELRSDATVLTTKLVTTGTAIRAS
jgi:hypothetical protein